MLTFTGNAKLLRIYCGEAARRHGMSVAEVIVRLLKENGVAGATVSRGVMGYGRDGRLQAAKVLEISADLPLIIEAVDTAVNIDTVLPKVLAVLPGGLCFTMDLEVHFPRAENGLPPP